MSVLQDIYELGPAARRASRSGGARYASLKKLAREATQRVLRRGALGVAGLTCFTAAAFTFAAWTGLVVAGVSFLVLEHRAGPDR